MLKLIIKEKLYNNNNIESELGKLDIICVEDLIHEINTVGKNFTDVIKFLKFEINFIL